MTSLTRAEEASTSAALPSLSPTERVAMVGAAGKRQTREKLGMSCDRTHSAAHELTTCSPVASYAEVLIDVRAHTETIVNVEPVQL